MTNQRSSVACRSQRPTRSQIMARMRASREAAQKLTELGMRVVVTKDDGSQVESTVECLPWELGHGQWVVGVKGISGGYDCNRVRPAMTMTLEHGEKGRAL